jgi:predicted NAD/FAD-binding protein
MNIALFGAETAELTDAHILSKENFKVDTYDAQHSVEGLAKTVSFRG